MALARQIPAFTPIPPPLLRRDALTVRNPTNDGFFGQPNWNADLYVGASIRAGLAVPGMWSAICADCRVHTIAVSCRPLIPWLISTRRPNCLFESSGKDHHCLLAQYLQSSEFQINARMRYGFVSRRISSRASILEILLPKRVNCRFMSVLRKTLDIPMESLSGYR